MNIIFLSNYFTHHQKPISDAYYSLTHGNYMFLATDKMDANRKKEGWSISFPDYVQEMDMSDKQSLSKYIKIINAADIVIQGSLYDSLIEQRAKMNKLTYIYTERLYKSPKRYLKLPLYLYKGIKYSNCYILAASAFTPLDYSLTRSYINKYYKFGYFPKTVKYTNINELLSKKDPLKIVWVARLIDWKHPEMPLFVAKALKEAGYKFNIEMIGTGYLDETIKQKIFQYNLNDCVHLLGSKPASEVRSYMESAGIGLITSDRNEGWGAVLNEMMNSGCAVVANSTIGAAPYLIENDKNGYLYKDKDVNGITQTIMYLLDNTSQQKSIAYNAISTITDKWNAEMAASRLIELSETIISGKEPSFIDGPCSKAEIIKNNWFKCQ